MQTALKLLAGQEQELLHAIPLIMGCNVKNVEEMTFIETTKVQNIRDLVKENAFSHLMEVGSYFWFYPIFVHEQLVLLKKC